VGDGKVIKAGYDDGGGYMIKIRHNSVYTTSYMHLSRYAKGIRKGAYVKQGDVIGYVGSTGLSTGPHLDFRFYWNNQPINPLKVEAPPVEPIKEENRQAFDSVKAVTIRLLSASSL
jgi:murein DD-endopeptidase MepM/ murein hydrolase activator NlpD